MRGPPLEEGSKPFQCFLTSFRVERGYGKGSRTQCRSQNAECRMKTRCLSFCILHSDFCIGLNSAACRGYTKCYDPPPPLILCRRTDWRRRMRWHSLTATARSTRMKKNCSVLVISCSSSRIAATAADEPTPAPAPEYPAHAAFTWNRLSHLHRGTP